MASALRLQTLALQRARPLMGLRRISTSKKNQDTIPVNAVEAEKQHSKTEAPTNKNWVSYGFEKNDEAADRSALHLTFFGSITLCMVFGGFAFMYAPDINLKQWAQREAFVELRRREAAGLPLIDRNLIDPARVELPSDEELGDTEIII